MSELAILFDEAIEAPMHEMIVRFNILANSYRVSYDTIVDMFYEYVEAQRAI